MVKPKVKRCFISIGSQRQLWAMVASCHPPFEERWKVLNNDINKSAEKNEKSGLIICEVVERQPVEREIIHLEVVERQPVKREIIHCEVVIKPSVRRELVNGQLVTKPEENSGPVCCQVVMTPSSREITEETKRVIAAIREH